ncbi:MAG: hypothetical protein WCZ72_11595 [Gemmobacter sp.]
MNRTEFIVVTAIILFIAFSAGWFAYWLLHRFRKVPPQRRGEIDRLARALHEAEEARDDAIAYMHQREAELMNRLTQTEAELRAAMDGLRSARAEADDLRARIVRTTDAG